MIFYYECKDCDIIPSDVVPIITFQMVFEDLKFLLRRIL